MWELKTARDLRNGRTFVVRGDYHASARKITTLPVMNGDSIIFSARPLWGREPAARTVTLDVSTPVYILTCTCNGMSFITNGWVFTGECLCVHRPLPLEN